MTVGEVVGERRVVCALAALEVVSPVAGALVVVGEDDQPCAFEVELLLGRGAKGPVESLSDLPLVGFGVRATKGVPSTDPVTLMESRRECKMSWSWS
jgi:hypothetical protein